ncbi:alpha/beta hydrolase-fold protein, partial [Reichenbachiella sp.]|uniref:alpha/beta hydrolase n=1 Tax=Reichenbachiella sp. TaxID=2184521 RepID=UPI0032675319
MNYALNMLSSAIVLLLSLTCFSQSSVILESKTIESAVLNQEVRYSVYLPPGYEVSTRKYPVLYLLHGFGDDETRWIQRGNVQAIADQAIESGSAVPMIIVMPDAQKSWYLNSEVIEFRYEDFFVQEFIPFIEGKYKCRTAREQRAISGLSMGGHGTIMFAAKYPDLFSSAAPLSAAIWTEDRLVKLGQKTWDSFFELVTESKVGDKRINEFTKQNFGFFLMSSASIDELKTVRWYIDCGDDDSFIFGNMSLYELMKDGRIPGEFRVRDGGHNWSYW